MRKKFAEESSVKTKSVNEEKYQTIKGLQIRTFNLLGGNIYIKQKQSLKLGQNQRPSRLAERQVES